MAMDTPEQRECVLESSRLKSSLNGPTLVVLDWRSVILYEALIERSRWWVSGKFLTGVIPGHPCARIQRKMLAPTQNGQAAAESDWK